MNIEFEPIDINSDFDLCVAFRRDSYFCSFNTYDGYEESIVGYRERMTKRLASPEWFYRHVWLDDEVIGQLEFRSFSDYPDTGYVHLIYLVPDYRGTGVVDQLEEYIAEQLSGAGCVYAILSVSRLNERAIRHYTRWGWDYFAPNPKHGTTDFYRRAQTVS